MSVTAMSQKKNTQIVWNLTFFGVCKGSLLYLHFFWQQKGLI